MCNTKNTVITAPSVPSQPRAGQKQPIKASTGKKETAKEYQDGTKFKTKYTEKKAATTKGPKGKMRNTDLARLHAERKNRQGNVVASAPVKPTSTSSSFSLSKSFGGMFGSNSSSKKSTGGRGPDARRGGGSNIKTIGDYPKPAKKGG